MPAADPAPGPIDGAVIDQAVRIVVVIRDARDGQARGGGDGGRAARVHVAVTPRDAAGRGQGVSPAERATGDGKSLTREGSRQGQSSAGKLERPGAGKAR